LLSTATPLNVLKAIISSVHDIGIPKITSKNKYIVDIDTSRVSSLDFKLSEEEKSYLRTAGKRASLFFFEKYLRNSEKTERSFFEFICRRLRG